MKLNNTSQMILTVVLLFLGNILGTIYHSWVFRSIAFMICGLLWIVNPVLAAHIPETKERIKWVRVAGVILIFIGIFTRMIVW